MTSIASVTLEVADTAAAAAFYDAFGVGDRIKVRASDAETSGFRGFALSVTVAQPSVVNGFFDAAVGAGATVLKPAAKSFWGYGGILQAPDGTVWKIATSNKKDTGPDTRVIDDLVLLIGATDVAESKK
ncbi:glyoxalase, partial [Streptomyces sp. NPDC003327]